jgi:hypothetical protein
MKKKNIKNRAMKKYAGLCIMLLESMYITAQTVDNVFPVLGEVSKYP